VDGVLLLKLASMELKMVPRIQLVLEIVGNLEVALLVLSF